MSDPTTVGPGHTEYTSGLTSAETVRRLSRMLNNISGHNGIRIELLAGHYIKIYGTARGWNALFDLFDVKSDEYKIRGVKAEDGGVWIAGAYKVIAETDLTWDNTEKEWFSETITDDTKQYVYLEMDRDAATVTIIAAATLPDGTAAKYDYTEIVPLWYIPWDDTDEDSDLHHIDAANIIDMRHAARLPAMA